MPSQQIPSPVAIIGGGPAGLMAAETISAAGVGVALFDTMPSLGRKFLLAGIGGLNLTHAGPVAEFNAHYGVREPQLAPLLDSFDSAVIRSWAAGLGIDTFVGSSGRVFPAGMKAAPLLRRWLQRLRAQGVAIHVRHRWLGWDENGALRFDTPTGEVVVTARATVLALGGGSWARLGSDGSWVELLRARDIDIAPLRPANCGFEINWSLLLRDRFAGAPLKPVALSYTDIAGENVSARGELIVTRHGVEGGLVYAHAAALRDLIERDGRANIQLDLAPDRALEKLTAELSKPRGSHSLAKHLHARAGIDGVKASLLYEVLDAGQRHDMTLLAATIKSLPLRLTATRPLDEAISSAGGVRFEALDEQLMVSALPGLFCAGEMLDWEAPTGGYLLSGCLASGRRAGQGVLQWLSAQQAEAGYLKEPGYE